MGPVTWLLMFFVAVSFIAGKIFIVYAIPTILNFGISVLAACLLSKRFEYRFFAAIAISGCLATNVRLPSLILDAINSPASVESHIENRSKVSPFEKVFIDDEMDGIFYRRTSGPAHFFVHTGEWLSNDIRYSEVPVVHEETASILRDQGISTTRSERKGAVSVRIRSTVKWGMMNLSVEVMNAGEIQATYQQRMRQHYLLEEFNESGAFTADWRRYLFYLTQYTPWNPDHEIFPLGYSPLRKFLSEAIEQSGMNSDGEFIAPVVDPFNDPTKLSRGNFLRLTEPVAAPSRNDQLNVNCKGQSHHQGYVLSERGIIKWDDQDIPPLTMPLVGNGPHWGYWDVRRYCDNEDVWVVGVSSYPDLLNKRPLDGLEQVAVWHYKVSFPERSLRLQKWTLSPLPGRPATYWPEPLDPYLSKVRKSGLIPARKNEYWLERDDTHLALYFTVSYEADELKNEEIPKEFYEMTLSEDSGTPSARSPLHDSRDR